MVKHKKCRKKFNYNKNRRRIRNKQKKPPHIGCNPVKKAWDEQKSIVQNLKEMGLSADPNKSLRIATTRERLTGIKFDATAEDVKPMKTAVIKELELEASAEQTSRLSMADPDVQFCTYMINKYGDNYVAMACDRRNYYQETPKQIQKKIKKFNSIPKLCNESVCSTARNTV